MNRSEIGYRRLRNQRIAGDRCEKPGDVVRHLGAMQAQDYHQVLWAIGSRMQHASISDIERSIADREIVLTWAMRGTIHAVPPESVRSMLQLLTPRILAGDKRRLEQLELTTEIIEQSTELVFRALHGNQRISRPDAMQLLEEAGICTTGQRGYHLLWHMAQTGLICLGPREGKQQTFVLLDEWVPPARDASREEVLLLLTERYYAGHGPATVQDFAWWTGLTLSDARLGLQLAKRQLESAMIDDRELWYHSSAEGIDVRPSVYLLPGFDEYLLGYKDRSDVLLKEHAKYIIPGGNGVFMPNIVIDGQIAGVWKRKVKTKGVNLLLELFAAHDDRMDELIAAASRYGEFMGLPLLSVDIQVITS
ncbi:winged helix DNA-binding domain-containing protein [Paenibacillus dokdonensis]|uniref:Winged helix DNA-binding domain-containing protein n=1 Tax=Paenibacillus dokdonensis TaxID=2567944 RepID=A0ABU6GN92_9BACL|nr:winged helix DNA-binding domain-containing protein [Paenibacillus dokdonensis]MEC0240145.1 winged helix DNA-binding domain-containing protein [Paenibacillus dokdonensis]